MVTTPNGQCGRIAVQLVEEDSKYGQEIALTLLQSTAERGATSWDPQIRHKIAIQTLVVSFSNR